MTISTLSPSDVRHQIDIETAVLDVQIDDANKTVLRLIGKKTLTSAEEEFVEKLYIIRDKMRNKRSALRQQWRDTYTN